MASSSQAAPAFVRLAAHPLRWRLLTELADSDLPGPRAGDAGRRAAEPGLLPPAAAARRRAGHRHAQQLRRPRQLLPPGPGPLRRGAGRHRRRPAPGAAPGPAAPPAGRWRRPRRVGVLFVCTGNSARSPIAEALLRHRTAGQVEVDQRRQPSQAAPAPQRRAGAARRVRHRRRRPAPAAPGHARRPPVRLRDHPVRQGPRGLPRVPATTRAGCTGASPTPPPPAARPRQLPRLPAHRGRHRHPHPAPAARPRRHPPRRSSRDHTRRSTPASATSSTTSRPPSTSTPPTSASRLNTSAAPAFADVVRGPLRLLLSGPASSGARATPDDAATAGPQPHPPRSSTTWTPRSTGSAARACRSAATWSPAPAGARSCSPTPPATSSNCSNPPTGRPRPVRRAPAEPATYANGLDLRNLRKRSLPHWHTGMPTEPTSLIPGSPTASWRPTD